MQRYIPLFHSCRERTIERNRFWWYKIQESFSAAIFHANNIRDIEIHRRRSSFTEYSHQNCTLMITWPYSSYLSLEIVIKYTQNMITSERNIENQHFIRLSCQISSSSCWSHSIFYDHIDNEWFPRCLYSSLWLSLFLIVSNHDEIRHHLVDKCSLHRNVLPVLFSVKISRSNSTKQDIPT